MTSLGDLTARRRARLAAEPDRVPDWLTAPSCLGGGLSPDGHTLAYISDRDGLPALWLTGVPDDLPDPPDPLHSAAARVDTGPAHVRAVSWSPDGEWLACELAAFGGEHTEVVVLRPDGTGRRRLGGGDGRAVTLGAWQQEAGGVGVSEAGPAAAEPTAHVADPATGERTRLVTGPAAQVCTFSPDGRFAVVRVGRRGTRQLLEVHVGSGRATPVLPEADATVADARFAVDGSRLYVHTDSGRDRPALLALPWQRGGLREDAYARHATLAARLDADLDAFAVCGDTLALVWNTDGHSELELREPARELRLPLQLPEGTGVVRSASFAGDLSWLLVRIEGPAQPPTLVRYRLREKCHRPHRLLPGPSYADELVEPRLLRFDAADGLRLSGWWYPPAGGGAHGRPAVLWLHGGPEAQERPTFAPLLQALAAAGIGVFGPNVRGSSGYGRRFVNADNHDRRWAAIDDVAAAVRFLVGAGLADPARIGCSGRSYGGYLTLAALVEHPELFRAGVDVCGMSDLETFFAHTEPWIASAATSKYGDPARDRALLRELSPLHRIDRLRAPLLVVHGEHDTNVPLVEARQVVAALQARGAAHRLLLFPDEGHEIHGLENRTVFVAAVVEWLTGHLRDAAEQTA